MSHGSKKVILLALGANAGIAAAKFGAFFMTASASMMAEAIHSLADTGNQLLLLLGMKKAAKPPDERHPFGYKMESYFWSFIVAVMLFSMGGLFAIYEGMHKLDELSAAGGVHTMENPEIAIGVLIIAIFLEKFSWYVATKEVNHLRGKESLLSFIEGSKSTEIIVIWMEDTAALVGLFLALGGILLVLATGNPYWDAYATFAIGVLLVLIAFFVARETKSLLIGESATQESQDTIRKIVEDHPGVTQLMNMRTMQLGEDEFLVALKVQWGDDLDVTQVIQGTNAIESRIRETLTRARYIFIEADRFDEEKAKLPTYPA